MALVPTDRDLTFMAFMQRVSTPASCLKHLEAIRWRAGEFCPKCAFVGQMDRLRDGKSYKCPACKKLFMVQRIRQAAGKANDKEDDDNLLAGIIEIAETSIKKKINIRANGQRGHKDGVQRPSVLRLAWRNGMVNAVRLPPQPQRHKTEKPW